MILTVSEVEGYLDRPYSRGGPDVFVDISVPHEFEDKLPEIINAIQRQFTRAS
jgi:hypothetical protein